MTSASVFYCAVARQGAILPQRRGGAEKKIKRDLSSPRLCVSAVKTLGFRGRGSFREAAALDGGVEFLEGLEQLLHAPERPGVGAVGQRPVRVRVGLHEQPADTGGDRRAREHRAEFAL